MKIFWLILIIALICWLIYYISTLSERRRNKEIIQLYGRYVQEKIDMERAKNNARIEGELTRQKIEWIADNKGQRY